MDVDFDAQYGHLTRPLKEAAKCWDIDLGDIITSYLAKENDEDLVLDPNHMMNFAQAGLLVSGTATNYGRKVEHLYTLTYTTLDSLSKGEGKSLAASTLMKKLRKRIVGFQEFENGLELLDAQFEKPAKGIDLSPSEGVSNGSHITRRVPLLLLPREDAGEKAAKDASKSANGTETKISSCWISSTGCLLLDPSFAVFEESDNFRAGGRGSMGGRMSSSGPLIPGDGSVIPPAAPIADIQDAYAEEEELFDAGGPPSPVFEAPLMSPVEEAPASPAGLFPPLPPPSTRKEKRPRTSLGGVVVTKPPPVDPFKDLDPHAVPSTGRNVKPKTGRCYTNPPALKMATDLVLAVGDTDKSRSDLFALTGDLFAEGTSVVPSEPSRRIFGELEYLADHIEFEVAEAKKKAQAAARERRKEELKRLHENQFLTSESESEAPHSARPSFSGRVSISSFHGGEDLPLNTAEGRTIALVPAKAREDRALQLERERLAVLERVAESSKQMYDEFLRSRMAELAGSPELTEQSANVGGGATALAAAAAVQERIPELYANIRKWQDNLEPLLEEQQARPVFDLDDYLVSIIDKLKTSSGPALPAPTLEERSAMSEFLRNAGVDDASDDGSPRQVGPVSSFEDLVKGEPKWNVCRLFLSTLILTNNGNVEIFNDGTEAGDAADTSPKVAGTPAKTPARLRTPGTELKSPGGTPLRGSHVFGASQSFQVKLRNADKNLKFAIQDNAAVVTGVIPIMTNKDLPPLEPIGEVPYAED